MSRSHSYASIDAVKYQTLPSFELPSHICIMTTLPEFTGHRLQNAFLLKLDESLTEDQQQKFMDEYMRDQQLYIDEIVKYYKAENAKLPLEER
jgi:hypothetical protein